MTPNAKPLPTPAEIDALAKEYLELKDQALEKSAAAGAALQLVSDKGQILQDLIAACGSAHAEKSKIVYGLEFEAFATYSQFSSVDSAAVDTFRDALKKSAKTFLIGKMFEKSVRWTLRSEASTIIRGFRLSPKLSALWGRCILLKDKKPTLTVRPRQKV